MMMATRQLATDIDTGAKAVTDKDQHKGVQSNRATIDPLCHSSGAGIVVKADCKTGLAVQHFNFRVPARLDGRLAPLMCWLGALATLNTVGTDNVDAAAISETQQFVDATGVGSYPAA